MLRVVRLQNKFGLITCFPDVIAWWVLFAWISHPAVNPGLLSSTTFAEIQAQMFNEPSPYFTVACRLFIEPVSSLLMSKLPSASVKHFTFWLIGPAHWLPYFCTSVLHTWVSWSCFRVEDFLPAPALTSGEHPPISKGNKLDVSFTCSTNFPHYCDFHCCLFLWHS